jgi:mannose-binding lectin 2
MFLNLIVLCAFQFKFPYVTATLNDGTMHYDHANDGRSHELGGCVSDFRGKDQNTRFRIKYIARTQLSVYMDVKGFNDWEECFTVQNVTLPTMAYMGFSSHTGDAFGE